MKSIFKNKFFIALVIFGLVLIIFNTLYYFNIIPHQKYSDKYFNIDTYTSKIDIDGDGIDDQSDFLTAVKEYVETNPEYKSVYYDGGYPNDQYGVCTDVVAFGLLGAGYDLQELVNEDIIENPEDYDIDVIDDNIDFRRVRNLKVYFDNTAISLTTDTDEYIQWQAGDIVIFEGHIGVVSDHRNKHKVPFVIHNGSVAQKEYEQDILEIRDDIIGHYRIS